MVADWKIDKVSFLLWLDRQLASTVPIDKIADDWLGGQCQGIIRVQKRANKWRWQWSTSKLANWKGWISIELQEKSLGS